MNYESLIIKKEDHIGQVIFNRPEKANALDRKSWEELQAAFNEMDEDPEIRVVVLSGEGKHFTAGIDLSLLMSIQQLTQDDCEGRKREKIRGFVKLLQAPINAIENCRKPVLAAIHNGCIGGGLDIITACDMRYCTEDAYFTIKEIDMGMVADLGTLQRLPKIINMGFVAEMAYTGRKVHGQEALAKDIVNSCFNNKEDMMESVLSIAKTIASKSPLSIRGTKEMLRYSRDHSVEDGLNYISTWNAAMILSNDLSAAFTASMTKQEPEFKN